MLVARSHFRGRNDDLSLSVVEFHHIDGVEQLSIVYGTILLVNFPAPALVPHDPLGNVRGNT